MPTTKDPQPKPVTNPREGSESDVAGIILAAGQSSRMGAFKPLLPFGPSTVIETGIQNFRRGGVAHIIVVVGQDSRAQALRTKLKQADVIFAVNPDSESEMAASIACGVRALPESIKAVVINPVDHAAVPPAVIALLIDEWKTGGRLIKPTWNNLGGHPVLIDMIFRQDLLVLDSQAGLKGFLGRHQSLVRRLPVKSNLIARDMDTWDDYRSLHQEVFGVLPASSQTAKAPGLLAQNETN